MGFKLGANTVLHKFGFREDELKVQEVLSSVLSGELFKFGFRSMNTRGSESSKFGHGGP